MNLPKHVYAVKDRHGKTRFRFVKRGLPSRYVKGEPGTEPFQRSYADCFDPSYAPAPRRKPKPWVVADLPAFTGVEVVYFIGGSSGAVKIGTTINLRARLKKLQTDHPRKLRVLACASGGSAVEAAYHERFAACRVHGEWFAGRPVRKEITQLRKARWFPTLDSQKARPGSNRS